MSNVGRSIFFWIERGDGSPKELLGFCENLAYEIYCSKRAISVFFFHQHSLPYYRPCLQECVAKPLLWCHAPTFYTWLKLTYSHKFDLVNNILFTYIFCTTIQLPMIVCCVSVCFLLPYYRLQTSQNLWTNGFTKGQFLHVMTSTW